MTKILRGRALVEKAKKLGVDTLESEVLNEYLVQSRAGTRPKAPDYELQRRIIETERSIRENRLWLVAVISALASVISAIVSLIAVSNK